MIAEAAAAAAVVVLAAVVLHLALNHLMKLLLKLAHSKALVVHLLIMVRSTQQTMLAKLVAVALHQATVAVAIPKWIT